VSVIGNGTCGDRCPSKFYGVYGAAVTTPMMEHRASLEWPCDFPFSGVVKLSCDFGFINATSLCQARCEAGNVTLDFGAVIQFPRMMSGVTFSTRCPVGFLDVPVVIQCKDGKGVVYSGGCFKHCQADWFYDPKQPDPTRSWSIQHYEIMHGTTTIRECPKYFDGLITLSCWSGKITMIKGHCSKNCRPGRFQVRAGVVVRNREMLSGFLASQIPCPPSFNGNMRLACNEGVVSLGYGGCNSTCSPGVLLTAPYGELNDFQVASIACPDTGSLKIECNDGLVSHKGGRCKIGCKAGTVIDANGTRIEFPYIRHNESIGGACSGLAKGVVTVRCNDTRVQMAPMPGERCLRFCRSQPVLTPDGSTIFPPNTEHGNQATVRCPNAQLGLVTVSCYDTEFSVIDGVCGDSNCPESFVYSNNAPLSHFAINNGWQAGPTTCPAPYRGIATFQCNNGTVSVDIVTIQLPVSPEDYEAVAIGNASSEDSRFVMCGCCNPLSIPDGAEPVKGRDTGIFMWAAAVGAGAMIVLAGASGWYFLPRKKTSRVWPEKVKPQDPRPIQEASLEKMLDTFQLKLKDNPELAQAALERNFKLAALPPAEQKLAIENMKANPQEAKKFFTRRSVQYMLAMDDGNSSRGSPGSPPISPKSATSKGSRIRQQPGGAPPPMALVNDVRPQPLSLEGGPQPLSLEDNSQPAIWQEVSPIQPAGQDDLRQLADTQAVDDHSF